MSTLWESLAALDDPSTPRRARAAVLVPLYVDDGGVVRVVLTKRPRWMRTHPGDVVFPGGRIEEGETVVDTALREAEEEIGLDVSTTEVLGVLPWVTTRDPRNVIVPVVARVVRPDEWVPEPSEVETVIEPPFDDLLDDGRWRTSRWLGRTMWFYDFPDGVMWGATAFMMRRLIELVRGSDTIVEPTPDIDIRMMGADDVAHVRRTLYLAADWNPERDAPPPDELLDIPYLARFHRDWPRDGDIGVAAFTRGRYIGGAFGRTFTHDDHAHGFVDENTPEIAVGVEPAHRGRKLGGRLLVALEDVAREQGYSRLSLSVELANPAQRLYRRLGYRELDRDDTAMRMVKALAG